MAISLNDHEIRIKAIEDKIASGGISGWTKGSNSNGFWAKESSTGLIIQWGTARDIGGNAVSTFTFPLKFSNTDYHLSLGYNGQFNNNGWIAILQYKNMTTAQASVSLTAGQIGVYRWIAIGYLISDRILNYIYAKACHIIAPPLVI